MPTRYIRTNGKNRAIKKLFEQLPDGHYQVTSISKRLHRRFGRGKKHYYYKIEYKKQKPKPKPKRFKIKGWLKLIYGLNPKHQQHKLLQEYTFTVVSKYNYLTKQIKQQIVTEAEAKSIQMGLPFVYDKKEFGTETTEPTNEPETLDVELETYKHKLDD